MSGPSLVAIKRASATVLPVTIANGQSLSAAIDLKDTRAARISMPATWTTANLTFQASADGTTYQDLYKSDGTEYTVTAAASKEIILTESDFKSIRYLKIRSGTGSVPVAQGADRAISLTAVAI